MFSWSADEVISLAKDEVWIKISAFKPILTQPEIVQECLSHFYLMAFTSDVLNGGADDTHAIEITAKGNTRRQILTNLPGDDYLSNKGDLWTYPMSSFNFPDQCIKKNDITNIAIVQNNNDGWHISSVTSFFTDITGKREIGSIDIAANRWIDGDSSQDRMRFDLTLVN